MNKPRYFPMYVLDFTGDDKVELMSTQEVGAYFLLLCKAWHQEPPGSVPNDDRILARWARLDADEWRKCKERVLLPFQPNADGTRFVQKRMAAEYEKMLRLIRAKSRAGKKSARVKQERRGDQLPGPEDVLRIAAETEPQRKLNTCSTGVGTQRQQGAQNNVNGVGGVMFRESVSVSSSSRSEEGSKSPESPNAEDIAAEWSWRLARKKNGYPADLADDVAHEFRELIRLGWSAQVLMAQVKDPKRDRSEHLWQFRDRVKKAVSQGKLFDRDENWRKIKEEREAGERQRQAIRESGGPKTVREIVEQVRIRGAS